MPTDAHLYKIRDKRRFLIATMRELAGTARISFEGDLSATAVAHLIRVNCRALFKIVLSR